MGIVRMEIEFNTNKVSRPDPPPAEPRKGEVRRADDDALLRELESLEKKLRDVPEIRTDRVETASELVVDVQYPPEKVLRSLATLLALKFR